MEFKKPAKSDEADDDPPPIHETDLNDVMATVRQLFADGVRRDRDTGIRDLAAALGYQRVGPRIREYLHGDLMAAVRRGILENERGELAILCRSIGDYERAFLKEQFKTAIGKSWCDRDDAIRTAARHLGFARTGKQIQDELKSVINGLLRQGELEKDGGRIRVVS